MNQFYQGPSLPLNQGGLRAIDSAILGCLPLLKRRRPAPSDMIHQLHSIRLKLTPCLRAGGFPEGAILPLSLEELRLIEEALRIFIAGIRSTVAPSTQRENILQELEALRQCIQSYL